MQTNTANTGPFTRRSFLKALAACAAAPAPWARGEQEPPPGAHQRPNVILVMTDDQGYGDLSCHGHPLLKTPNLDRLHAQSVRLTNFHVCPTCTPTRAGLLTGRYSLRTGVWHTLGGRSIMRADEVTMAQVFRRGGYRTGIFGKWHLGDNYPHRPQERGFDETLVHGGGGIGQTPDYWGNDYFDDTYWHNGRPSKVSGYCTDVFFDAALRFIEANRDRRFFCYLPTNAPHSPYNVADKYSTPFKDQGLKQNTVNFYGMIANIDENMGRLLRRLEELGLDENTILIFMTDNGSAAGHYHAGMRGRKGSQYDGGHRVPCFIRWPGGGLAGGRDVRPIAAHIDLLPTLIELCRLRQPVGVEFDGASLGPLLRGQVTGWPDRTLFVDVQRVDRPIKWRRSAVMTDRWRLIDGEQLYDMKMDPGQQHDVADAHPDVVKTLRAAYEKWWADISTRFHEDCAIPIGADEAPLVRLAGHDWHGERVPWAQNTIRRAMEANGFWVVEVLRDGTYEISLRRWPLEVDAPINAPIPDGDAISVALARLKIADIDATEPVAQDATQVTFTVALKAGQTRLQTWLTDDSGVSRGAYYVYVRRLP